MTAVAVLASTGLRGRRRVGLATTLAVLVLAAVGIVAGMEVSRQGGPILDEAAADANVAHLVIEGDADAVRSVAVDPEVVEWAGPFATVGGVEMMVDSEPVPMEVTALDVPEIEVNSPPVKSGRWASAADEIVLDRSLAADLGIALDTDLSFVRAGTDTTFVVVGTAVNFTDCFYPQCEPGRAWVTTDGLGRLNAADAVYAQGYLRFDDPAQADPFVQRQTASGVAGIDGTNSWLDTRNDFLTFDRIFGAFVEAFGVFVLLVSAVVIAGSTAMRIVARRREIGLLGAVGCRPSEITAGILIENLLIGLVATLAGWCIAGVLAPYLQIGIGRTLGVQGPSWSVFGLVVCVVVISVIMLVATVVPAISAARRPVTDVLRDVPRERVSWLNRRARHLPSRLPLIGAQEAASEPTRGSLAALAIAVAVVGSLVSIGFVAGIDAVAADPARAGDPWDVALIPGDVPASTVETVLARAPGVESWFSDIERRSTFNEGAFLAVATGGDPGAAGYQIAEGRPMKVAGEAIAGYGFLQRFGVSVGDTIDVLAGTAPVTVQIVGWYRETEDSGEVLRYRMEGLAESEPSVAPQVYRITTSDDVASEALAAYLVQQLGPSARTEILDTGSADLAPLMNVLWLIAIVLLVMAGANLLSTLLTTNREGSRRVGAQLAVGFTPRQIKTQGAVTGAVVGLLATVIGVPLGLWIFHVLSDVVSSSLGVGPGWMPAPRIGAVLILAVGAWAVSATFGAVAAGRITRRPASELVRGD